MVSKGEQDRARLKEEYKEHYRKIKDAKEKLRRNRYTQNVADALNQMNSDELLESVDEFLGKVRNKMASIEARLDVAMEQFSTSEELDEELEKEVRKKKANDTLRDIKLEMGLLYNELEKQADEMNVNKTIGSGTDREEGEKEQ